MGPALVPFEPAPGVVESEEKHEEEDEIEGRRAGPEAGRAVTSAAAVAVPSRRNALRRPLTPSMFSRRCLEQRRAFMSETYPKDGWRTHPCRGRGGGEGGGFRCLE